MRRHSASTTLLSSGFDVARVAMLLGHGSPAVTLSVYTHVLPASEDQAAERLGAIL
jgi:site-specific recombinase XerD